MRSDRQKHLVRTSDFGARSSRIALTAFFCFTSALAPSLADDLRRSAVVRAIEKASPAVANISTERVVLHRYHPLGDLFADLDGFYGRQYGARYRKRKVHSLGSGVLFHANGYLLTNEHVVSSASRIIVTLADGKEHEGTLVSSATGIDLAVVKIDAPEPLPYIGFADSDDLYIGETAIALGNPLGLEHTVTVGVVSAKNRSIPGAGGGTAMKDLVQTDASINPGNSGGPLVNIHGRLIGLNVAIIAGAEGIGFAIPVNKIKPSLLEMLDPARVAKIWTGLKLAPNRAEGTGAGLAPARRGAKIAKVEAKSPAAQAGLRKGDIIFSLDGSKVNDAIDLYLGLLEREAGTSLRLGLRRGSTSIDTTLTLSKVPLPTAGELAWSRFGLRVTPSRSGRLLISAMRRKGPAHAAGLKKGDAIYQMGGYLIQSGDDFNTLMKYVERGDVVLVKILRGKYRMYAEVTSE